MEAAQTMKTQLNRSESLYRRLRIKGKHSEGGDGSTVPPPNPVPAANQRPPHRLILAPGLTPQSAPSTGIDIPEVEKTGRERS